MLAANARYRVVCSKLSMTACSCHHWPADSNFLPIPPDTCLGRAFARTMLEKTMGYRKRRHNGFQCGHQKPMLITSLGAPMAAPLVSAHGSECLGRQTEQ